MYLTIEQGRLIIQIARATLDNFVAGKTPKKVWDAGFLAEKRGVFSTLSEVVAGEKRLRGCIGFPYPVKRLGDAIEEATVAAASEDPRFPPVQPAELNRIVVEVSALTVPKPITVESRKDLPKMVKVGRDGLMMATEFADGLLLPQVATEFGLNAEDFLSQTCVKAGLLPDSWLDKGTRVSIFQAEIFAEKTPRGEVVRVEP